MARDAEGALCGFVHLLPSFDTLGGKPIWILEDLFVAEEARNRGIGSMLLDGAYRFAHETGSSRLTLSTAHDIATAQRLYRRNGWVLEEHFVYFHKFVS